MDVMHLYSQATNPYSFWRGSCCMHFYSQRHLSLQHCRTTPPTSHPCSLSKPPALVVVMLLPTTSSQQTGPRTPPSAPGLASSAAGVGRGSSPSTSAASPCKVPSPPTSPTSPSSLLSTSPTTPSPAPSSKLWVGFPGSHRSSSNGISSLVRSLDQYSTCLRLSTLVCPLTTSPALFQH
ncbi:putative receptor-like protein kinase [Iris pallida]|uniref:Receptor-like protein kinase n=1 Tax=Iris pallida TaxID=29817 RepID=A0AAX6EK37_IRIPA|nr:putative receptor-like protein kinase [Iris pallida]